MTVRRTRLSHIAEQRCQCDLHEARWEYNEVVGPPGTSALSVKRASAVCILRNGGSGGHKNVASHLNQPGA